MESKLVGRFVPWHNRAGWSPHLLRPHQSDSNLTWPIRKGTDPYLLGINAKFIHASLACATCRPIFGALKSECVLLECDINQRAIDIVEKALETKPCLIGIGFTYGMLLWFGRSFTCLKKVSPQTIVVLGAPEVSFEIEKTRLAQEGRPHHHWGRIRFRKLSRTRLNLLYPFQSTVADTRWPARTFTGRFSLRALSGGGSTPPKDLCGSLTRMPLTCEFCLSSLDALSGLTRTIFLHKCKDLLIAACVTSNLWIERSI